VRKTIKYLFILIIAFSFTLGGMEFFAFAATPDIWNGTTVAASFASGNGTAGNPYRISNGAELARLAYVVNSNITDTTNGVKFNSATKHYALTQNIYLNDTAGWENWDATPPANGWKAIGDDFDFLANFNGAGFSIFGIYTDDLYAGLFGTVDGETGGGRISNLGVEQSYIRGSYGAGGIAAVIIDGVIITNCYNAGTVASGTGQWGVGGIAGEADMQSKVLNCYNTGDIKASAETGGVVGILSNSQLINCYNSGEVTGGGYHTGGIAGRISYESLIANCYNTGTVTAANRVGGIVGSTSSVGYPGMVNEIHNCYNAGVIIGGNIPSAEINTGGIAGSKVADDIIESCYYITSSAVRAVGGFYPESNVTDVLSFISGKEILDMLNDWVDGNIIPVGVQYLYWKTGSILKNGLPMFLTEVWDGTAAPSFAGGTGTESSPYLISNGRELAYFRNVINANTADSAYGGIFNSDAKYYKFTDDIYLNNTVGLQQWDEPAYISTADIRSWTPIGTGSSNSFKASLDGAGFAVFGIYISNSNEFQGLFGFVEGGRISNLGTEESYMKSLGLSGGVAGMLTSGSSLINCYNTSTVTGTGNVVGGVIGRVMDYCEIVNCFNKGEVTGKASVGGVSGDIVESEIVNCYNAGNITGISDAGGVTGHLYSGIIANCYNTGNVIYKSDVGYTGGTGGIASRVSGISGIYTCYNKGTVTGGGITGGTGGIAGYVNGSGEAVISNCYNAGTVADGIAVGDIIGDVTENTLIENCSVFTSGEDIIKLLNFWIKQNNAGGKYNLWRIYNGYPVFLQAPLSEVVITHINGILTNGTFGSGYTAAVPAFCQCAADSTGVFRFTLINGVLPEGLTLNSDTGIISGIPATATDRLNFIIRATLFINNEDTGVFDEREFSLAIDKAIRHSTVLMSDFNEGEEIKPSLDTAVETDVVVIFYFDTDPEGAFTSADKPTTPGTYWVRAVIGESSNYAASITNAVRFVIRPSAPAQPGPDEPIDWRIPVITSAGIAGAGTIAIMISVLAKKRKSKLVSKTAGEV